MGACPATSAAEVEALGGERSTRCREHGGVDKVFVPNWVAVGRIQGGLLVRERRLRRSHAARGRETQAHLIRSARGRNLWPHNGGASN